MQKPSERHNFTSDNNIIKFKRPVHDPFNKVHSHSPYTRICLKYTASAKLTHLWNKN